MQVPAVAAPLEAPLSVTVTPVAADASAAVTSLQASTLVISFALAAGEGVTEAFEEALDDPQALTRRTQVATTAIKPLGELGLTTAPLRVISGPVLCQAGNCMSSGVG